MSKCIFAGSFDPWHNGHEDRLLSALKIFDEVKITVGNNPKKSYWFNQKERVDLIKKATKKYGKKVEVIPSENKMIHDICHDLKIYNVFRGVKAGRTLEEELRLQVREKTFSKDTYNEELLFIYDITTEDDFRGSSIIKLLIQCEKNIDNYIPKEIAKDVLEKGQNILNIKGEYYDSSN